ncbi:MAG: NUDIX domain-containing protein [Kibdelosporangium sp.]
MIAVKAHVVIVRPSDGAMLLTGAAEFVRPPGGTVEFGELAVAAARREILEELGCELAAVSLAGVLENRFVLNGVDGHEIVFVFRGALSDELYSRESFEILDVPGMRATWWTPALGGRLVPEGLSHLLAGPQSVW